MSLCDGVCIGKVGRDLATSPGPELRPCFSTIFVFRTFHVVMEGCSLVNRTSNSGAALLRWCSRRFAQWALHRQFQLEASALKNLSAVTQKLQSAVSMAPTAFD